MVEHKKNGWNEENKAMRKEKGQNSNPKKERELGCRLTRQCIWVSVYVLLVYVGV